MPTLHDGVEEQSLEQMIEAMERRQAREEREDDAEAAFDELIRETADIRTEPTRAVEELTRANEFVCANCHMVLSRALLADPEALECLECFVPGQFGY